MKKFNFLQNQTFYKGFLIRLFQDFALTYKTDHMKNVAPFLYPKKKELH